MHIKLIKWKENQFEWLLILTKLTSRTGFIWKCLLSTMFIYWQVSFFCSSLSACSFKKSSMVWLFLLDHCVPAGVSVAEGAETRVVTWGGSQICCNNQPWTNPNPNPAPEFPLIYTVHFTLDLQKLSFWEVHVIGNNYKQITNLLWKKPCLLAQCNI